MMKKFAAVLVSFALIFAASGAPLPAKAVYNPANCYIYYPQPGVGQMKCDTGTPSGTTLPGYLNGGGVGTIDTGGTSEAATGIPSAAQTLNASNATDPTQSINDYLNAQQSSIDAQINSVYDQASAQNASIIGQQGVDALLSNSALTQCSGTGSTGGSLSNILSGKLGGMLNGVIGNVLGPQGSSVLKSVGGVSGLLKVAQTGDGNINLGNLVGGITGNSTAGSIVNSLVGKSGTVSLDSLLSGNVNGLLNGSGIDKALQTLGLGGSLGSSAFNLGGSIFTNSSDISSILGSVTPTQLVGGSLTATIPNILADGTVSGIAGSITGALGSVSGLLGALPIAGALLGGGTVPVTESTLDSTNAAIQAQTKQIQKDQDTYVQKICNQDIAVKSAAAKFAADFVAKTLKYATTGNGGRSIWAQPGDAARTQDVLLNDFVSNVLPGLNLDSSVRNTIQKNITNQYQYNTDIRSQLECPVKNASACLDNFENCGTSDNDRFYTLYLINNVYPQCNPRFASQIAQDYIDNWMAARQQQDKDYLQQGRGIYPRVSCLRPKADDISITECAVIDKVLTTGAAQETVYNQALVLGTQKQAGADEIGKLVDTLFAELGQNALTSLTGALGLSQKSSSGNGSYLDRVAGNTTASSLPQAKLTLQANIEQSIALESQYQSLTSQMITDLTDAQTTYTKLESCYSTAGAPISPTTTPQALVQTATSTLSSIINPQLVARNAALTSSKTVLAQLATLDTSVGSVQTVDSLNGFSDQYQALISSGALHTSADIDFATADRDASKITLASFIVQITPYLNACSAMQPTS